MNLAPANPIPAPSINENRIIGIIAKVEKNEIITPVIQGLIGK